MISAKVEELANMSELENFSYENILSIKNSGVGLNKKDPRIIMLESNRIPPYMIVFPRRKYKAKLYIDENVFPTSVGEVIEFYWNDIARYFFKSEYIEAIVMYDDMNTQPF